MQHYAQTSQLHFFHCRQTPHNTKWLTKQIQLKSPKQNAAKRAECTGLSFPFAQAHSKQRHYNAQDGTAKQTEDNTHLYVTNLISYRHAKHQSYHQALLEYKQGDQLTLIHNHNNYFTKFSNKGTTKPQHSIKTHSRLNLN